MSNLKAQLRNLNKGLSSVSSKLDISEIKEIVKNKMYAVGLYGYDDFVINKKTERDGSYTVWLSFSGKKNGRVIQGARSPSFYDGYNGIYSVILPRLLNTGFHTSNYIYGMWHGKKTRSLRERTGYHFLEEAVEEFNREHRGLSKAIYIKRDAY